MWFPKKKKQRIKNTNESLKSEISKLRKEVNKLDQVIYDFNELPSEIATRHEDSIREITKEVNDVISQKKEYMSKCEAALEELIEGCNHTMVYAGHTSHEEKYECLYCSYYEWRK